MNGKYGKGIAVLMRAPEKGKGHVAIVEALLETEADIDSKTNIRRNCTALGGV